MLEWRRSRLYALGSRLTRSSLNTHQTPSPVLRSISCTPCCRSISPLKYGSRPIFSISEPKIISLKSSPRLQAQYDGEERLPDIRPQELQSTAEVERLRKRSRERPVQKRDRFADFGFERPYYRGTAESLQEKERESPFGLAFAENPYAQSLAGPVRECCFTGAKLPRSHLLDFHVAEEGEKKRLELLPLSLLAKMVPKKKALHKLTPEEKNMREEVDAEANSFRPLGSASYVVSRRKALEFVQEEVDSRVKRYVLNRRTKQMLATEGLQRLPHWREDMPDFVLETLRKLIIRNLRYFFNKKVAPDRPATFAATPGCRGLLGLDMMDKVLCVLRLTPSDSNEKVKPEIQVGTGPLGYGHIEMGENFVENLAGDEHSDNDDDETSTLGSQSEHLSDDETASESDDAKQNQDKPTKPGEATETDPFRGKRSKTHKFRQGSWSFEECKTFMGNLQPLPPPSKPPSIYYPTIRYRNRRIPVYSLPQLLGQENADELVRGSAFKDINYVVVRRNFGNAEVQNWLMKLQTYLGGTKDDALKL